MSMTPEEFKRVMLKAIREREPMLEEATQRLRQAEARAIEERPVGIPLEEALAASEDIASARERLAREQATQQRIQDEADVKIERHEREKARVEAGLAAIRSDFSAARKVAEDDAALMAALGTVEKHRDASDFGEAMDALAGLRRLVNETRQAAVRADHSASRDAEAALFAQATQGIDDFDTYETILEKTPDRIAELNRAFDAMLERSRELAAAGASLEEQKKMFRHIPENFWPDRFFEELDAWRITEAAFLEEAVGKLFEAKKEVSSTAETIESTAETAATIGGTLAKAKPSPEAEAFLKEARERLATVVEDVKMAAEIGAVVAGIAASRGKESTPEERVKVGLERAKAIASVSTGILDQVAEHLESVEQLQAAKAVIDLLTGVHGPVIDMATSFIEAGGEDEKGRDASKRADERLEARQAHEEALWKAVTAAASTGVSVTKVLLPLAGEVGKQVTPILGVPSNGIAVVRSVKDVLETRALRGETTGLAEEASAIDPRYVRVIEQELAQLNENIAKSTVNAVGNVIDAVGSVTTASGAAHVGAPIAIVGKAITYGGKAVFFVVDNVHAARCQELLEAARAGSRDAREEIFSNSGRYAKMFIAIGATRSPPDAIALKFIEQRGMTEADLNDSATSTFVVRRYLLAKSGEKDDHRTIADTVGEALEGVSRTVGDALHARDRSIPYGDEQKRWTYRRPVRLTGAWWLATERDAITNGLGADAADGLQGAFSAYESSLAIARKTDDPARWSDHYEAARELHRRVVGFDACTNTGERHVAMDSLRAELLDLLNPIIEELQERVDPAAVAARRQATEEACRGKLQEASQLIHELDAKEVWKQEMAEAVGLISKGDYPAAMARLEPVVASLVLERQRRRQ